MRREAAAELAARGASVTLACRNVGAAEAAAAEIRCCCGHLALV
jgi:NAD(P)-dependent dehydrogenase (short-subunit alcohol dehydrogenase family)